MPKTFTFHVGLPKTGSTTIQKYLRYQEEKLRSFGFLYPGPRDHQVMDARLHHPMMLNAMAGKMIIPLKGLDVQACREVVARVSKHFRESDLANLIWSHEGMAPGARNWDAKYLARLLDGDDVRIVFFARYTDDWLDSLYKQKIWARAGRRAEMLHEKPLRPLSRLPRTAKGARAQPEKSLLGGAARMIGALRIMRQALPTAEIIVRSFDANREKGRVVSGALEAMGVPVEGVFPDADDEAGVRNPTKSDLYSMLLHHLVTARADTDVIREVAAAARKRDRDAVEYEPLSGRRFRFLSDEDTILARGYYEELREHYSELPAQPPFVSRPGERFLPKDEGVALLDWLRPDISDSVFDQACAAYPADPGP